MEDSVGYRFLVDRLKSDSGNSRSTEQMQVMASFGKYIDVKK